MSSPFVRCVAAALLAITVVPAARAGGNGRAHYDPYAAAVRAPVCTQAELSAGIHGEDCGRGMLHNSVFRGDDRGDSR